MYQHQVLELLEELNLDYYDFESSASYDETNLGRCFSISDVANYIDAQISLREFKRTN